jgi:hypothetical protein
MVQQVGKATVADHLAVVARMTGRTVNEDSPKLPREMRYLWRTFLSLHRARTSNGWGPNPITWSEMDAFCRLTGSPLDPWEAEAVRALDEAFLEVAAGANEGATHV